jgi:hypothetical protein
VPVSIAVKNLTVSDLTIQDLGLVLGAISTTDLTSVFSPDEIRFSNDLNNSILADEALIQSNGSLYTKEQSLIFMSGGGLVSETLTIIGVGTVTIASGTNLITVSGSNPALVGGTNITVVSGTDTITISSTAGGVTLPLVGDNFISVITGTNSIGLFSSTLVAGSGTAISSGTNTITVYAPENFSYETIASGVAVEVPLYQQMVLHGELEIIYGGNFILEGTMVLED